MGIKSKLFVFFLFVFFVLPTYASTLEEVDVTASQDDVEENYQGDFDSTATSYYLANKLGAGFTCGVRFLDVDVAQGATIDSAFLRFSFWRACNNGECKTVIHGEDSDSSLLFTGVNTPADRTPTTDSITYDSDADDIPNGELFLTLTITDIVQEIINRGGWSTGNPMAFLMKDNGSTTPGKQNVTITWYTWDHVSATVARLSIHYTVGAPPEVSRRRRLIQTLGEG